ncbi:leucine-rich repeat-containing protein [Tripterygium wilfordii]|uniref:Leucine-rich repeat-containing protein n=1 Tax=Tripterygium wilfordii TaxID=458696 RepID=A0A7J7CL24_TRIWF|nr:leucine-rich repeat-containing protein [Tripterygium wilfordii]
MQLIPHSEVRFVSTCRFFRALKYRWIKPCSDARFLKLKTCARDEKASFYHIDPEKDEELRGTKQEIEDKVKRIRKLVNEDHGEEDGVSVENSRKESLADLIDDFYEHYQSLYAHYDHLTGELRKKVHDKQDKESSSSSSDSDSDKSSKHKGDKNGKMEGEFRKMMDELKLELEAAKSEVTDLKRELIVTREEKEALDLEYQTALSRIKEADEANRDMMLEADRLTVEKSELLAEKEKLDQDLYIAGKIEAEQSQRLENIDAERHNLLVEKETAMRRIEEGEKITEDLKTTVDRLEAEKATLGQELETLKVEISDFEKMAKHRENEISALIRRLEDNENESVSRTENLTAQINSLLADMDSLRAHRAELEVRILFESGEASTQVKGLVDQVNMLQQELESLNSQKAELEMQLEKKTQEITEQLIQVENMKEQILGMTNDQHRLHEEKESLTEQINHLQREVNSLCIQKSELEEHIKTSILENTQLREEKEYKLNLEVAQKKIGEMAEEFRRKIEAKIQKVAELEEIIEELRRDVEVKGDELNTLVDYVRTLEVKLRLSNQKLRVTEQLLTEKEESFRDNEAKFLEEQKILEERITSLAQSLAANSEAYDKMITDVSGKVKNTMAGADIVIHKFEEDFGNYESCIVTVSKELQSAMHWVRETNNEREQLKTEISSLCMELKDKKEQESMFRERVGELEMKARKVEGEKEILIKTVQQLEMKVEVLQKITKEKDEGISGLGEEKREAIRQLCLWIDYHRSRNDYLREVLSKIPVRGRRTT